MCTLKFFFFLLMGRSVWQRIRLQIIVETSIPFFNNDVGNSRSLVTALKDTLIAETGILCSLEEKGRTETCFVFQIRQFLFSVCVQSLELWTRRNPRDQLICACVLMWGQVWFSPHNTCSASICSWKPSGMIFPVSLASLTLCFISFSVPSEFPPVFKLSASYCKLN